MDIETALTLHPEGIYQHFYSDTLVVCELRRYGYSVYAFTRYGEPFGDDEHGLTLIGAIVWLTEKWGYPASPWQPLVGCALALAERPSDCAPPYGVRWLAEHPTDPAR